MDAGWLTLVEHVRWPIVVVIIAVTAMLIFRRPLEDLIDRLRTAKAPGSAFEFGTQENSADREQAALEARIMYYVQAAGGTAIVEELFACEKEHVGRPLRKGAKDHMIRVVQGLARAGRLKIDAPPGTKESAARVTSR